MDVLDLIFMVATCGFFGLCLAYIPFCQFLKGSAASALEATRTATSSETNLR